MAVAGRHSGKGVFLRLLVRRDAPYGGSGAGTALRLVRPTELNWSTEVAFCQYRGVASMLLGGAFARTELVNRCGVLPVSQCGVHAGGGGAFPERTGSREGRREKGSIAKERNAAWSRGRSCSRWMSIRYTCPCIEVYIFRVRFQEGKWTPGGGFWWGPAWQVHQRCQQLDLSPFLAALLTC